MNPTAELHNELPAEALLSDPADLVAYGKPWRGPAGRVDLVVRLASVEELRTAVRWAVRHRVRLVPQGANTGLVGAGTPSGPAPATVLSTARLTAPLRVLPRDAAVVAGAGVRASNVQAAAARHGLFLPIDLSADASIGGLIATNAGGSRVLRYGDVRRRTLAVQAVLADEDASVIGDLKPVRKRNDGPRLADLMIGSGGQLGVVVAAVMELAPAPHARSACFLLPAAGPGLDRVVQHIERTARGRVSALELLSRESLQLVARQLPSVPVRFLDAVVDDALLLELEDDEPSLLRLLEYLPPELLVDIVVTTPERAWALRHCLSEAQAAAGTVVGLDVCVPRSRIGEVRTTLRDSLARTHPAALLADFGHVGDGGLHLNVVLCPSDGGQAGDIRRLVYETVEQHGGTFSAKHGLGPANLAWWTDTTPPAVRHALSRTKKAFDPAGVLGNAELALALSESDSNPAHQGADAIATAAVHEDNLNSKGPENDE